MPTYSPVTLGGVAVTPEVIAQGSIPVLDHGFVRLDEAMADDLSVVNGARVSFARHKTEMDESDAGLIRFLMRDRHGKPFEHDVVPLSRPLPDVRRARMVSSPRRRSTSSA